jgi:hypothetical protein
MHLLWENIVPTLVDLWTGRFKGLDMGVGGYEIAQWDLIGEETAAATTTIPAGFVRAMPNIAKERYLFTAEAWAFWIMYLAPHLLEGRLANKYYEHMVLLVDILKLALQFVITEAEVDELEQMIIRWVRQYEKCVLEHNMLLFSHFITDTTINIKRSGWLFAHRVSTLSSTWL